MTELETFVSKFDNFSSWDPKIQIDFITYFLTGTDLDAITAKHIADAFYTLSLRYYQRTPQYLSENANDRKTGKYIKRASGYRLERKTYDEIDLLVKNEPAKLSVSKQLTDLVDSVKNTNEKEFLIEAINCYRVRANRATVIMMWNLTLDHLKAHIYSKYLPEFNIALAKNPDKKILKVVNYDDFNELKEVKFIDLARSANIISNDVKKILDEKLGVRNSAAHPSTITISDHKATEFIMDLLANIVLKY